MQDVPLWRLRPPRVCGKTEVGGRTKCLVTFVSFRIPHIREDTHNHLYAPSTRLTFAKITCTRQAKTRQMKPEYQPCSSTSDLCSNAESTPCLDEHGRWPKQKKSWLTSRLPLWTVVTLFVAATLVNAVIFVQRSTSSQQHVPLLWNYFCMLHGSCTYYNSWPGD